jgi:methylmalonyl-CoA mutase N-terminal domain/subunit
VSLTAQQPYNNVVRTALQALSAVLGGANSLHTNALDEALALPTAEAATLALRTQQILAHEVGVTASVDPLGGSWSLERQTSDLEHAAMHYIEHIDRLGGMVAAIEQGYPQREIAQAAYQFQQAVDRGERHIIGVNVHADDEQAAVPILEIDERVAERQRSRLEEVRRRRHEGGVSAALRALDRAARGATNTMGPLIECARAYATVGEICDVLRTAWGEYVEAPAI